MADVTDLMLKLAKAKGCFHFSTLAAQLRWTTARVRKPMDTFRRKGWVVAQKPNCYIATETGRKTFAEALKAAQAAEAKKKAAPARWKTDSFTSKVWKAIRTLQKFDIPDLVQLAAGAGDDLEKRDHAARTYVGALRRAGYLRVIRERCTGGPRTRARYLLKHDMNTGPRPPAILADGAVRDRNLDRVVLPPRGSANRSMAGADA
jgi:hypothetical protein